ncbi:MAG: DEAD/DEAH box helicase [Synergistaceae bacterium]|nr:DEAD/DEAH box helicase [Synergistaceae bacterium]
MSDATPLMKILQHYKNLYSGIPEDSRSLQPLKGKWFENICLYFLKHDPIYINQFSSVWLWSDWPGRNNRPDTGIDIVAQFKDSDKLCAVQCKFYEDNHRITKDDINTFLAASGQENFIERIIFSISGDYNKNALDTLDNQQIKCTRLTIDRLENSPIDWAKFDADNPENFSYKVKRVLRPDQQDALNKVIQGFTNHDRGKMIMACGTGKTFVSLKIAEKFAGKGKKILYLVPSIALLNQTLLAWNEDIDINLKSIFFAVCSDSTVGIGKRDKDNEDLKISDLAYPATTKANDLISSWQFLPDSRKNESMTVIFSTYQSLQVINEIQNMGFPDFDLIICDEAHRTSGVTMKDDEDSNFVRVHDNNFIHAKKRLYMTATPKVYSESASKKAKENDAVIYSMDDSNLFGEDFYSLPFSHAIQENLLTDYRVMILAIDQRALSEPILKLIADRKITADDATKMFGCWRGLSKHFISSDFEAKNFDPLPMKTAVAFTSKIDYSKNFRDSFSDIIDAFKTNYNISGGVNCSVKHVDGTMNMHDRENNLSWLKSEGDNNSCKILSNARCLSEGVDVPALDAIIFLNPKKSKVDIVQAVGRVMRKSQGKKLGYVILPVVVPPGVTPEDALNTDKNYNVIWDVLQALRSHDDKFQVEVNSLKYDGLSSKIITGVIGRPDKEHDDNDSSVQLNLPFSPQDWQKAVYAQIVEKCGDREYDSKWAKNMSEIAQTLKARINSLLNTDNEAKEKFTSYLQGLRENINNSISQDDAVDMLSQHFVTKPIFDACFEKFSALDPVSKTSEAALEFLEQAGLQIERKSLEKFYRSQTEKLSLLQTDSGRQQRIKDLYENFFRAAFPKTSQSLGIVYTPNEVVDFILNSADWALRHELNISEGLSANNVNILDPFTGTGTFIVRLIQLGLIPPDRLAHKYKKELHANEILMLAYYIAAVNIEMAYHSVKPDEIFEPFPGVVLTDTFNENNGKQISFIFDELSRRAKLQHDSPITVIIGNPPYSVGQSSANDNNQNLKYNELDSRITESYAALSKATNKNSLYDSYIRAIRWASDRIENDGIICYVTNGSFIDSNSADGLRKCLYDEFQRIYIFNLRGNQYTSGESSRKEGGKIFGSGSRLPVAITLLVKNSRAENKQCRIFYRDIGDYLSRSEKLNIIERAKSFGEMLDDMTEIIPNESGDWINKRNEIFDTFLRLGNKKESQEFAIFDERYSGGISTGHDSWSYNFSREALKYNISSMIEIYNQEREKWQSEINNGVDLRKFVTMNKKKISWSDGLFARLRRNLTLEFSEKFITTSLYRPFTKHFLYYDSNLNERVYRMPSIFPTAESKNLVIGVTGIGSKKNFSVLMADCIPNVQLIFNSQCFPLYWYEEPAAQKLLFDESPEHKRRDAISDKALSRFRTHYNDNGLTKEDIFYYIYGVLSSPEYRERFGVDVYKNLARVPFAKNFREFSQAGR